MKGKGIILVPFIVLFLSLFLSQNLPAEVNRVMHDTGCKIDDNRASQRDSQSVIVNPQLEKAEFAQKTKKLQIPFIANNGQVDDRVGFYANTFGGTVFVTKDGEIVYALPNNSSDVETQCLASSMHSPNGIHNARCKIHETCQIPQIVYRAYCNNCLLAGLAKNTGQDTQGVAIKETLVGSRVVHEITGNEKAVTKVSYFKGNDPSQWKSNISTYDVVSLGEVYDGIELKLKAYGNNVEKLFCVKPDANPDQIQVNLSGAKGLRINDEGQLVAETELGAVKFTKPVAYQEINGKRVDVTVEYKVESSEAENKSSIHKTCNSKLMSTNPKFEYGFAVAYYDKTKDLIIDPLLASTYLGESSSDNGISIVIDPSGNIYVAGYTESSKFPTTTGAYDTSYSGRYDVFISKLNNDLTSLLASTYLGGNEGIGIIGSPGRYISTAIDQDGNIYVTGYTASSDFPTTTGAYDTSYSGGYYDVFISKLNNDLTSLHASTYLGGTSDDSASSIAIDASGNIYVAGTTGSSNFPTTIGAYNASEGGFDDIFVSKLKGDLTSLLASTSFGGGNTDWGSSIAIDSGGNIYVAGYTSSSDFPTTTGAYDTSYNNGYNDAFVSKLNGDLTSLLASTYLGGTSDDSARSIAIDASGGIYVAGSTASSDFPTTPGAYDTSFSGGYDDAFVSKLNGDLTGLLASTYLGGSSGNSGSSIAIDSDRNIYVVGYTTSSDFPITTEAYDTSYGGYGDTFVSKLNEALTNLLASTYLGGPNSDIEEDSAPGYDNSVTIDSNGNIYIAGVTPSSYFPTTTGAYKTSNGSGSFVSKFDSSLSASPTTESKGKISGYLINKYGDTLKFVSVKLKLQGKKTKITKIAFSDKWDGFFEFKDLEADTYVITASKKGYKKTQKTVKLKEGEAKDIQIMIKFKGKYYTQ